MNDNPFRMTPSSNPQELIWAGFGDIKEKIAKRIKKSVQMQNSSLVLNWGEYGSGKTHAAKYFQKKDVLQEIAGESASPFTMLLDFPKGKNPVQELYIQIIDKLDITGLRNKLNVVEEKISLTAGGNVLIESVLKYIFDADITIEDVKTYLYGNASISTALIGKGIQRKLSADGDYIDILAALFTLIAYNKEAYSCTILWIDEFEDITIQNTANIIKLNNLIRGLMDKAPNNLLIFMNLTQSAMMDVEDLGEYLQSAVYSRIRDRIELPSPSKETLKEYIRELINNKLFREADEGYAPFEETTIDKVIEDLGKDVSLRRYNEAFSILLEDAAFDEKQSITVDYYNNVKDEVIGWK